MVVLDSKLVAGLDSSKEDLDKLVAVAVAVVVVVVDLVHKQVDLVNHNSLVVDSDNK